MIIKQTTTKCQIMCPMGLNDKLMRMMYVTLHTVFHNANRNVKTSSTTVL